MSPITEMQAARHFRHVRSLRLGFNPAALLVSFWITGLLLCCQTVGAELSPSGFRYDGRSELTLELGSPDQGEIVQFAVAELERYFSRILKQNLTWKKTDRQWPDHAHRIRLQVEGVSRGAAVALPAPVFQPGTDEFQIDADAVSVTITGSSASSLLYAVYDLLEQQGCLWLFPGDGGEIVPAKDRIDIPAKTRSRADLSMRGLFPVENLQRYTTADVRDMLDWMAKNRLNYFVAIANYGWDRLGQTVLAESRKRGIRIVGYIWSFEIFLPLETGRNHPEYFAFFDGKRQVDYNVKRCAASDAGIKLFVENGCQWLREHPEIEEWIVIPNDGFHWCECEQCRKLKPKDQWAAFFIPLMRRLASLSPRTRLQNFIYVTRYGLPENMEPYRRGRLDHFFDVHQRNKWFSLRDAAAPVGPGHQEAQVDERARGRALNLYLADRLQDWRKAVPGRIWIFENLMLHGTYSIPVPNLQQLGDDLQAAHSENVQGYLFEAYLQGWNSFAPDLWSLARLCWDTKADPEFLERNFFRHLLGAQSEKLTTFYDHFRGSQLQSVRRCGSLYWMHCAPVAVSQYVAALRSVDPKPLSRPGSEWLQKQLQVAAIMEQLVQAGARSGKSVVGEARPPDVVKICCNALQTGRAMDGVFLAYEQLRQLFLREFASDSLGFRPILPATFNPDVRELFGHQKLWDTLAEWETSGRFPRDPSDPDRWLTEILQRAIEDYRASQPQ